MPPIKFTINYTPGEPAQEFTLSSRLGNALDEAVAAQPGMTVEAAVEFAIKQYVASSKHFLGSAT